MAFVHPARHLLRAKDLIDARYFEPLDVPGPPVFDAEMAEQIRSLMAKGGTGGLFFATDDCRASYEELKGRGVEFTQEPTEQPYGIDIGIRDPSGNHIRIIQSTQP